MARSSAASAAAAAAAPRYQNMGMGAVMTIFLGVAIGSLVALFFRGGLQASGRRGTSMFSLFLSPAGAPGAYQRSQAQQFLRSMEDASGAGAGPSAPAALGGSAAGSAGSGDAAAQQPAADDPQQPQLHKQQQQQQQQAACDCEACTSLLDALGLEAPAHWGDAATGECECGTCTALMRLSLQAQGITSLEVNRGFLAGAFGDVRALLQKLQALSARPPAPCAPAAPCAPCAPAAAAAAAAAATSAAGTAGSAPCQPCPELPAAAVPKPCPLPAPCPAAPQCSPEQAQGGPAHPPASAAAAPALHAQRSATGGAPVWPAALALRGVPAPPCSLAPTLGPLSPAACAVAPLALPTRCVVGRHEDHWNYFVHVITRTREPLALLRYVDGERMILQGTPVGTATQAWGEDKWQWEGGESRMAADMGAGLRGHYGEPVFYAFASPQDDEHGLRYYLDRTEATCGQVTYANLWINGYYHRTKAMLLHTLATQHARTVLVANHEGLAKHAPCAASHEQALAGCVPVPDNAVHAWEAEDSRSALVEAALALAHALPAGSLFVVCAGPLSKPLIAALWDAAPRHQYIDFGSAMDETLKGRRTRPYMDADSSYAKGVDPQWFCHRGPAGLAYNGSRPAEADFAEGRCHTFSTPEGE